MSSSTALLPKANKKDDHPIFLRVCHSPWVSIGQNSLVSLRGLLAVYMLATFLIIINYEIKRTKHGWLIPFELSNVAYLLQLIYQLTSFIWTFMHLHYPHHGSQAPSHATRLQKLLSPPRQHQTTKNRAFFSIFYVSAVTFPHVVSLIYWAILVPRNDATPVGDLFGPDWFKPFVTLNKYVVNSIIALIEVVFLSSIRRQTPIWAHIVGLTMLSLLYVGWAYIGKMVTDKYSYYFLDYNQIGWEYVVVAVFALCALANIFFSVIYGLTGLREMLTKKGEDKSYGYTRLPQ